MQKKTTWLSITTIVIFAALYSIYFFAASHPHILLSQTTFDRLPSWESDKHSESLLAFERSCTEILKRAPEDNFSKLKNGGKVSDWQTICLSLNQLKNRDDKTARQFFEYWFTPYRIYNNIDPRGLFTGYYLPVLQGSLKPDARFAQPVYGMPTDLVKINLGAFKPDLTGTTLIARVQDNKVFPYPDRSAITQGDISKNAPVLAWVDNAIDLFFAQIQGSALIELPDHQRFMINYAGSNGRPYTAIGSLLIANKALNKQNISMQTIRAWLIEHPDQINAILNRNASYVFFKIIKLDEPLGAEQVPLLKARSLAVDKSLIPLGAPLWVDTTVPQPAPQKNTPFQHLLVAQDTGGAIKGIVRGDIYWGSGEEAAYIAGHMQNVGQFWILLPRLRNAS